MSKSYKDITEDLSANLKTLRPGIADTMKGFSAMAQAATAEGALDKKLKNLLHLQLASRQDATAV